VAAQVNGALDERLPSNRFRQGDWVHIIRGLPFLRIEGAPYRPR
jgi:hypothetical protein